MLLKLEREGYLKCWVQPLRPKFYVWGNTGGNMTNSPKNLKEELLMTLGSRVIQGLLTKTWFDKRQPPIWEGKGSKWEGLQGLQGQNNKQKHTPTSEQKRLSQTQFIHLHWQSNENQVRVIQALRCRLSSEKISGRISDILWWVCLF